MNNIIRFCYECKHRRIVEGLPDDEFTCEFHPEIKVFNSTEATQCITNGDFDEIIICI